MVLQKSVIIAVSPYSVGKTSDSLNWNELEMGIRGDHKSVRNGRMLARAVILTDDPSMC